MVKNSLLVLSLVLMSTVLPTGCSSPKKSVVLGGLGSDPIRKTLMENLPGFRTCYQNNLNQSEEIIKGIVTLQFIIEASGSVKKANIKSDSELPKNLLNCIYRTLKSIKFPKPKNGGIVEVSQPINFYPRSK